MNGMNRHSSTAQQANDGSSAHCRMCGNGVASPVAEWLADMINQALENE